MSVPFAYLDDHETLERVKGRLQREGYTISPDALELLVESVGTHLIDIANEVEKIILAAGDNRTIDRELVTRVVGRYRTESVFELVDDLSRGNPAILIEKLATLMDGGDQPVFILTMLLRRVVLLMHVQALIEEKGPAVSDSRALAESMASGTSPFYAEILRRKAREIAPEALRILLVNLRWADLKLKTSAIPPRTLLEEALIASHLEHPLRFTA
ncbi:MAG: hypothetical protein IH969_07385 [Candidatus Krumholzibacteriota bacterium]|nr:hypothetical protein [Candidatus Krumholzibacteriota bacterium]